ncbi:hypothetical protein A3B42_03845 [Candidatus Daviesbacteria bacterium RIFCSPLOWO2_01_FULL_38_10]|uniref:Uncharacterized protein n=1 Tax=Candidatus Daviesbacteria bacterium GW2011_GWF2_38_6 TaxID=1618432 RepID=A0A0G0NKR1_9BACT|nr:MAG: hypothetical protein US80_C0013G0006 [Candidatus Daviesbacteria bacterium GW2011_GWA2_38_17]KKQ77661.1 MAG: hypothetical protein US99_C0036G0006 [Candidatus Daviesbacteria bacterium GW2011_GWF2_38_6]OGE27763.1 MAG: hypothetical protein A3D02_01970 [Candidatus Daviesbacteria bacterium RIFCSPHIGHO2_02_FULL_39_41]OGE38192.1 MAG: hypothetical protein A3B42_03845 [Candidatus Daviesbacteria bacterium RIFCSPLOWO2_01_FULL_38_10]OGE45586.1 MAG: hypothetical protein A3E67_03320 [Candidatus Davies
MQLKIAQVVGLNTDQKAAQVVSQVQDSENAFLALLQLTSDDAFTKGRQALSELADFYFDFEGSPAQKLTATFAEGVKKFSEEGEWDLCLAGVSGKVLYLTGQGQVEVFLKREDKLSPLLATASEGQLISGFLEDGDKLLLVSRSLSNFLGEDLDKSLDLSKDLWEEEISSKVGGAEAGEGGMAGLFVQVDQEAKIEEENEAVFPSLQEEKVIASRTKAILLGLIRVFPKFFPKSGRGRLILALILILIIGTGAGLKYKSSKDAQKQAIFVQILQSAKDDFDAAKGLSSLNPAEAKNKLESAKASIDKALALKKDDQEAQSLKKQIEEQSASVLEQQKVADFPLFLDLDLIKKDFKAQKMSLSAGKILVLDSFQYSLAVIDPVKKSNQILAGKSQLGEVSLASLNGSMAFSYSLDKGLVRTDTANQKQTQVAKADDGLGSILDMSGFAGNVYLLDGSGQIWKYLPTADSYSDKREYLSKNTKADFTNALRMQIESSVYVLKQGGEIIRFTKGEKDNFSYSGLPSPVKDPKSFFVSSDTDNLYLLDSGNSRLLVLTKLGAYKVQYQSERLGGFSDLVVDEKGKKVYLLDGSKIYTMDLK